MPSTAYCVVGDITEQFPRFTAGQTGNVPNQSIQDWIDDAGAEIYALFIARNIDLNRFGSPIGPGSVTPSTQQINILRKLNRESGTKDLAAVLRYNTTAQNMGAFGASSNDPRSPLTASRFRDGRFDAITAGTYDALFNVSARHISTSPTIPGSIAGGDQQQGYDPVAAGALNAAFTKEMDF